MSAPEVTRDLSRPIAPAPPLMYRGECQFSYNEAGTQFCGEHAPYRFELDSGNQHSTCPEHAIVVRNWPNLRRMWTDRQVQS